MEKTKTNLKQIVAVKTRNEKHYWTRLGVAYENKDGSWNLRFDYLPADLNGTTVQLRDINPARADGSPAADAVDSDEPRGIAASPF